MHSADMSSEPAIESEITGDNWRHTALDVGTDIWRVGGSEQMDEHLIKAIIVHPEVEELNSEIEKLRTEISMLVLERDHLRFQECKNIEMQYMLSIGTLEYKAYEIECAILRLKRKMELIRARKNRQERIDLPRIEETLDFEFTEYQERFAAQLEKVTAALERAMGGALSESEALEFRKLYRLVVKELHPDLHPEQSEERLRLFHLAVDAYERGDLQGLRAIHVVAAAPRDHAVRLDGFRVLAKERERLAGILEHLRRSIAEIRSRYPYSVKAIVEDQEKTNARTSELNERIETLNEILSAYTQQIEEMLR